MELFRRAVKLGDVNPTPIGTRPRPATKPGAAARAQRSRFALAVHGGAGVIERAHMSAAEERAYRAALEEALTAGHRMLAQGASSLDAVVAAVTMLEDSPLFNAGRGSVFTADGTNELDAAVMEGATLKAGAVTLVTTVKNPVKLARVVMEKTGHVMLGAEGAERLARVHGLEIVEPGYFHTERRWEALQRMKRAAQARADASFTEAEKHGTVGAVALDARGNLAAAASTGGRNNKMGGRIGDSPVIGAGVYASNATAAVSCTGEGETFMRSLAAYSVSALMELKTWSLARAAKHVIHARLKSLGGTGGLVALDRAGNVAMPFSTPGMYRGSIRADGVPEIAIYGDD
ncbi:MAG: isoaspartyl peptidase/L-asparaginase [Betaproteobacteria bacterium]|nr:isoaspartyl peptidase/L-asparaginase [Betaproteobacteria bacterium]